MSMRVIWTPAASDDLEHIYTYIATESPASAERVARAIVNAVEGLALFPSMGRTGAVPGTRERLLSRYPYKVVYRVQRDHIDVVRVINMAQDWP